MSDQCRHCKFFNKGVDLCQTIDCFPRDNWYVKELEARTERTEEALRELLKGGAHDGPCDNEDFPDDGCEKHGEASERRKEAAKELLSGLAP
jgi:hypothetical protein